MMECPHCRAKQSLWRLRTEFACSRCGGQIRSNAMSLGIIGIALASVATFLLPSSGWSLIAEVLGYLAVSAMVVLLLLPFVRLDKHPEPN